MTHTPESAESLGKRLLELVRRADCPLDEAKALIAAGADVCMKDDLGDTALHLAAVRGHTAIAFALIGSGAKVDAKIHGGYTALHMAALHGRTDIVFTLIANGAKIGARNDAGETAEMLARKTGNINLADCIHVASFEHATHAPELAESLGKRLLDLVRRSDCPQDEAMALIAAGADIRMKDRLGDTALHLAALRGHTAVVFALTQNGVEIDARIHKGYTPLQMAAMYDRTDIVFTLIANGAEIGAKNDAGETAEMLARKTGNIALADYIHKASLEHATKARSMTNSPYSLYSPTILGKRLLRSLCHPNCRQDEVLDMIAAGADVRMKDDGGNTPLHWAARDGYAGIISTLLEHGAAVNAKNNADHTPLHLAAWYGHTDIAPILIVHDAEVGAQDNNGDTAETLARKRGHTDFIYVLPAAVRLQHIARGEDPPTHGKKRGPTP